jgi:O-antigen ligase
VELLTIGLLAVLMFQMSAMTIVNSGYPRRIVTYFGYLLFVVAIMIYCDSYTDINRLIWAGFLSAFSISLLTIVHASTYPVGIPFGGTYHQSRVIPIKRAIAPSLTYGTFGMFIMMSLPYHIINIKNSKKVKLTMIGIISLAILISQSRSTWIAVVLGLFSIFTIILHRSDIQRELKIFLILTPSILFALILPVLLEIRSPAQRITQVLVGLEIIGDNLLTGVGPGNLQSYHELDVSIHNSFINLAARSGILSLAIVLMVWSLAIYTLVNNIINDRFLILSMCLFGSFVAVIIETNLTTAFSKVPWIIVAIAVTSTSVRIQ